MKYSTLNFNLSRMMVLIMVAFMFPALASAARQSEKVTLVFDIDQGFGNGIVVHCDKLAVNRIAKALEPLKKTYKVCALVNPMVAYREKFTSILDVLVKNDLPFVFDVYTSDAQTLGSCSTQNKPYDPRHGVTISLSDLQAFKKRYKKHLAGLRFTEVFSQDFTVRAVKTTNPEWALPCWKLPDDAFFQPQIAKDFLRFAKDNKMFVQWSDWHWFEFAGWDALQKEHEAKLSTILCEFPGLVIVTYANNEPSENSVPRLNNWEKSITRFIKGAAAGCGLSDQSWLRKNDITCPVDDIIKWAQSALEKDCRFIQFEPAWYFFKLPRGTFGVEDYVSDPKWADRGKGTEDFEQLSKVLLELSAKGT